MSGAVVVTNWSGVIIGALCILVCIAAMVVIAWVERRDRRREEDVRQWIAKGDCYASSEEA